MWALKQKKKKKAEEDEAKEDEGEWWRQVADSAISCSTDLG
mgnify:CR=1 FL=1